MKSRPVGRWVSSHGTGGGSIWTWIVSLILAGLALAPPGASAQNAAGEGAENERFPLFETVLGPFDREVTTRSAEAQAYFRQGMQLMYAFSLPQALASFQEAERADPECAMCFFGEAWARGPYLNGGMRSANAADAFRAIQRAVDLSDDGTEVERGLIEAMALRYTEEEDEARRPKLDSLYAEAMSRLHQRYPDDLDVGTLYAESLMLLDPRRGLYRLDDPSVQRIHGVLEDVLEKDITHPGACHLYVHATEATERPEKAEACADLLGISIPGSSHINHMPSHTYNRIGRWNSAVRANIEAWHSDRRAAWDEGVSYAATHNLHMLLFAASMAGQGGVAWLAGRNYAEQVGGGVFYPALIALRFGWWDEILRIEETPEQPIQRGLVEFARGYAHLRTGDRHLAQAYLERVRDIAEQTPEDVEMRGNSAADLLGIVSAILEGEILRDEGRLEDAIDRFEAAVEIHDRLPYSEPEVLNFGSRHWLGAALLEAGRPEEAEAVYRASLEKHPRNGWSLYGLELALRAQGRDREAREAEARFREEWSESDTLIRSSRF